jgi:phenylacetate-coenzyme A ligase PaaK-like adenylate-forming protein
MDKDEKINELITKDQFTLSAEDKEKQLFPIILEQLKNQTNNNYLKNFYESIFPIQNIKRLSDIPPIPVSMFKNYELRLCPESEVVRVLTSSGTTAQMKSKIFLDKKTAFRQTKALMNILKSHLGNQRKPMVIIDTEKVNMPGNDSISARGAAIRGLLTFAQETVYILDGTDPDLKLNLDKLIGFLEKYKDQEIVFFGFTYIIWEFFYKQLLSLGKSFKLKAKVIHSGGWKKLESKKVSKEIFNKNVSEIIGNSSEDIHDMYGMVEQVGVVFIDCEHGNKHVPNFADVIIRDPLTMEEVNIGKQGIIEIISVLPESYPGQATITEDLGLLMGIDDCKCGRKGKYFRFLSRIKESETRGCGDTFSGRRE